MEHVIGCELPVHDKSEALSCEFIYHGQYLDWPPIMCPVRHEIVSPDMIAVHRPEADARSIVDPEPPPLWLFLRNLQPLLAPDAFDPLMVDLPAVSFQKGSDPTIPIATVLGCQAHYRLSQELVRLFPLRGEPLSGTGLANDLAGTSLRYTQVSLQTRDASAAPFGAQ